MERDNPNLSDISSLASDFNEFDITQADSNADSTKEEATSIDEIEENFTLNLSEELSNTFTKNEPEKPKRESDQNSFSLECVTNDELVADTIQLSSESVQNLEQSPDSPEIPINLKVIEAIKPIQDADGERLDQSYCRERLDQSYSGENLDQSDGGQDPDRLDDGEVPDSSDGDERLDQSDDCEKLDQSYNGEVPDRSDGGEKLDQSFGGERLDQSFGGERLDQSFGGERLDQSNDSEKLDQSYGGERLDRSDGEENPDGSDDSKFNTSSENKSGQNSDEWHMTPKRSTSPEVKEEPAPLIEDQDDSKIVRPASSESQVHNVKHISDSSKQSLPETPKRSKDTVEEDGSRRVRIVDTHDVEQAEDRQPKTPFRRSRKMIDTPLRRSARIASKQQNQNRNANNYDEDSLTPTLDISRTPRRRQKI